jgi:cytoskeletal protein CcmA (bactofilin family)
MQKGLRGTLFIGLAALALAAGAPAAGESIDGHGVMVEKDVASRTVTLESGAVLRIGDKTRITDREGATLGMSDLVVARPFAGGLEVNGDNQIRFSGEAKRKGIVEAERIEVQGQLIQ